MNIARKICSVHQKNFGSLYRKYRVTSIKNDSSTQPQVKEEKFDFEDLKVFERVERRKAQIPPFMKDVFVSVFNRDLLAYPEILNKEETEALDRRISILETVFSDPNKTKADRKNALVNSRMYAAPVSLTNNGLAVNYTEAIRYLEIVSSDLKLSQELSDHWVGLEALRLGLNSNDYQKLLNDLTSGDNLISLCIKEKVAERILQPDFRTSAEMDGQGIWRITGEKVCLHTGGYQLVLCALEADRIKAVLVHPGAEGVNFDGSFITFHNTPGTLLEHITEEALAKVLGTSRLYASTLCRCGLRRAIEACMDYVRPRAFSGKPLSELATIRGIVGESVLDMYASESMEYFTAGLLDGYINTDAELEMAMCRNFAATYSIRNLLKLIQVRSVEEHEECNSLISELRHLAHRGESLDSISMFIALNGVHHAGKMMCEEIKQVRNPLFHPKLILKKLISNRHQENDDPKLNLYLEEYLHPTLRLPSKQLEYCVLRMRYACETLMSRHGAQVATAYTELNRLAEASTEILAMTSVLARASRSYCIGLRHAELEMKMAACFVEKTKGKVQALIREIDDGEYLNLDHFRLEFGKKMLDREFDVQKPTARVFW